MATLSLFVTDLDHTLVGDDKAQVKLNQILDKYRQEYATKIVYSTGRSLFLYQQLQAEKDLLEPDALVTAVGTEIYYNNHDTPDTTWSEKLSYRWNRDLIVDIAADFAELKPQPESEQRPFKVSYNLKEEAAKRILPQLESLLKKQGLDTQLIYSGAKDLDILPYRADKGLAMLFLRENWGIEASQTVVCGDSGNDRALFCVSEEKGIIVGNARPELLQWHNENPSINRYLAQKHCAEGILEGLQYFGFLNVGQDTMGA